MRLLRFTLTILPKQSVYYAKLSPVLIIKINPRERLQKRAAPKGGPPSLHSDHYYLLL